MVFLRKAQAQYLQPVTAECPACKRPKPTLFSTIVAETVNSLYQNPLYMPVQRRPKIHLANQGTAINPSYSPHEGKFSRSYLLSFTHSLTRAV